MALMSTQPVPNILNPAFAAVNSSDTIRSEAGLLLVVKVGGTATTITVTPAGNQSYSGVAKSALSSGAVTSQERYFVLPPDIQDPATGLITVTYSQVTGVTAGVFKIG